MKQTSLLATAISLALASTSALATNGMMLEGYGDRATAMGGASLAYDSGNSGALNNPATLSLMQTENRFSIAVRKLGPDVKSSFPAAGLSTDSDGTAYYMPSISYMTKSGDLTYGVAFLAQGGMGTEYGHANPGDLFSGGMSMGGAMTPLSGQDIRSEVGVAGLMIPLSKQVNDRLTVGGSLDFIAAMMDLRMDMSGGQFGQLMGRNGGSIGGSMAGPTGLGSLPPGADINWGRFDFSDKNSSTGEAKGYGWGAKLGFTYKLTDDLTIGGNYRSKTNLSDMTTNNGTMTMNVTGMGSVPMKGKVTVVDFQWPQSIGLGLAYQASDRLLLTGDVKHIGWADVMKNFHMKFKAKTGPFAGQTLDMKMDQKWRDQTAVSLGAEFKVTPDFSLRGGVNLASNPVPNKYVNPLFPAIIENHVTAGFGYNLTKNDNIGFSMTYAPEVKVKGSGPLNNGVKISHSQLNWSLGYSRSW